jgi:N,N'-diacetylchitobiose transport system permease protein
VDVVRAGSPEPDAALVPVAAAGAPGPAPGAPVGPVRPRRRPAGSLPYGLVLPSVAVLVGLLGYPLVTLVITSFRQLNLRELIRRQTVWVGADNYTRILADREFWAVTTRTLVFAAVCVALTLAGGTLVALLLRRVGPAMRLLVSVGMLLAWATPTVSAATVFKWLFDQESGVVNWLVTALTPVDWSQRAWFDSTLPAFFVLVLCVVWQAIPFVALTLYAGMTSIPEDIYEAARMDGAGAWRQFWTVTGPMLKPIFLILTSLSVIWDLKTFTQNYVITRGGPAGGTQLLNLYTYTQGFGVSRFGIAAAAAVIMVVLTLLATAIYVRSMLRVGEAEL